MPPIPTDPTVPAGDLRPRVELRAARSCVHVDAGRWRQLERFCVGLCGRDLAGTGRDVAAALDAVTAELGDVALRAWALTDTAGRHRVTALVTAGRSVVAEAGDLWLEVDADDGFVVSNLDGEHPLTSMRVSARSATLFDDDTGARTDIVDGGFLAATVGTGTVVVTRLSAVEYFADVVRTARSFALEHADERVAAHPGL